MPVDTFKQNTQVFGDYEVVSKIADGGMGTVYKGRHRVTGELVAIKVMSAHMAKNAVLRRRLEQEYKAAHNLNHPNIVRALAFGNSGPCPYLVMEFVEGESLGDRIERSGRMRRGRSGQDHHANRSRVAKIAQAGEDSPRRQAGQHPDHP